MQDIKTLIYYSLIGILLIGCTSSKQKISIQPYELFHDNSSKVWILESQFENNLNKTPLNNLEKWIIIFYADKTFTLTTLGHFSDYSPYQGSFKISDNKSLTYNWDSGQIDNNLLIMIDRLNLKYSFKKDKTTTLIMHFIPIGKIKSPTEIDIDQNKL